MIIKLKDLILESKTEEFVKYLESFYKYIRGRFDGNEDRIIESARKVKSIKNIKQFIDLLNSIYCKDYPSKIEIKLPTEIDWKNLGDGTFAWSSGWYMPEDKKILVIPNSNTIKFLTSSDENKKRKIWEELVGTIHEHIHWYQFNKEGMKEEDFQIDDLENAVKEDLKLEGKPNTKKDIQNNLALYAVKCQRQPNHKFKYDEKNGKHAMRKLVNSNYYGNDSELPAYAFSSVCEILFNTLTDKTKENLILTVNQIEKNPEKFKQFPETLRYFIDGFSPDEPKKFKKFLNKMKYYSKNLPSCYFQKT